MENKYLAPKGTKRSCDHCGNDYEMKTTWQKFCSRKCNRIAYRRRNGLSDMPDFPTLTAKGFIARERAQDKSEREELFNLSEERKHLMEQYNVLVAEYNMTFEEMEEKRIDDKYNVYYAGRPLLSLGFYMKNMGMEKGLQEYQKHKEERIAEGHAKIKQKIEARIKPIYDRVKAIDKRHEAILEQRKFRLVDDAYIDGIGDKINNAAKRNIIRKARTTGDIEEQLTATTTNAVSLSELMEMDFSTLKLKNAALRAFLGEIEDNTTMMISGKQGSGKSSFALLLANEFMRSGCGQALYISPEQIRSTIAGEQPSETLKNAVNRLGLTEELQFSGSRTLGGISQRIEQTSARLVVVDSVTRTDLDPDKRDKLIATHPKVVFLFVLQSTKGGTYKGSSSWAFDADIVMEGENLTIRTTKNRYTQLSALPISEIARNSRKQ